MPWIIFDGVFAVLVIVAFLAGGWSTVRRWLLPATALAAGLSIVASIGLVLADRDRGRVVYSLAALALVALIFMVVRRAEGKRALAAVLLLGAAHAALHFAEADPADSVRDGLVGIAVWWLISAMVAGAAFYLRLRDLRHEQDLAQIRRSQRLQLARDLHDFVAHDVSAILVQSQAAQIGTPRDRQATLDALAWIEAASVRTLTTMDQMIHALHAVDADGRDPDDGDRALTRRCGLEELPGVTARFSRTGPAAVDMTIQPGALAALPPEVTSTGYRVVVEALTNIRRHAPMATRVTVDVARTVTGGRHTLSVAVRNDAGPADGSGGFPSLPKDRRSGIGLSGLRERIEKLGGLLIAGPDGHGGWSVIADLPLPPSLESTG